MSPGLTAACIAVGTLLLGTLVVLLGTVARQREVYLEQEQRRLRILEQNVNATMVVAHRVQPSPPPDPALWQMVQLLEWHKRQELMDRQAAGRPASY